MMQRIGTGRADWALEMVLERAQQQASSPEVEDAITAAIRHMHSGNGRTRRGGRKLVELLELARLRASEESEWDTLRLVHDAVDYCEGRSLKPEFEERFRLFEDGRRSELNRSALARFFDVMVRYIQEAGHEALRRDETLTGSELLTQLIALAEDGGLIEAPEDRPGRYRIIRGSAETALWLERVLRNRIDIEDASTAARRIVRSPDALTLLADEDASLHVFKAVELKRRSESLAQIRTMIEDPSTTERDLQTALERQSWIFGGRYLDTRVQRRLVPGDEMDIPLIRADGSLHVVELKQAMGVRAIVKPHRGSWVPTAEVHDAVAQTMNYLVGLDENRERIRAEFGIDTRRASALVLIGHPGIHPDLPEQRISEVLRTFNAQMSRLEVLTYKELVDSAERALGYETV
ncbi:Shedu anti-phage system protein SduA domain-containing protein [Nocardia asteroides]|uniref:Shedu anti-phage system protein SduA domain-containing protein n=1 Tax=Nocardia asteroides TaxID=1824 RepID=UPI0033CA6EAC